MRHALLDRFVPMLGLAAFATLGAACSSDASSGSQNNGGGDRCDAGTVYDDQSDQCIPVASPGSDTGGDPGGSNGGNGEGDAASRSGGDANGSSGACGPRTAYAQVYRPNLLLMLDTSGSMSRNNKIQQAKRGLNTVANTLADDVRWGVAQFPKGGQCRAEYLLKMGQHSASTLRQTWTKFEVGGGTPAGQALYKARFENQFQPTNWLTEPDDAFDDERSKAVVLVTDGKPNDVDVCGSESARDPIAEARELYGTDGEHERRVPVYVVGFKLESDTDPTVLNDLAEAGGTNAPGDNRFFVAGDAGALASSIETIAEGSLACARALQPAPPEGSSVAVELDDQTVPRNAQNGFVYDEQDQIVRLTGDWCETFKSKSREGTTLEIKVGCPACNVTGESCSSDDDCCEGIVCEQGTCVETCRAPGSECTQNNDCCSKVCAEANPIGTCTSG